MADTYKRLRLTPEILEEAQARADGLPVFEYSHRERDANIVGCIGEVVFERFLEHFQVPFDNRTELTDHDYVVNGLRLDVKTKDRTVLPRRNYDNSVPLYNHEHQRPDFYYFVSLYRDASEPVSALGRFKEACIVGGIDISSLDAHGLTWDAGQVDPDNGTKFWTSCINVTMAQLLSNSEMLQLLRSDLKR